MQLVPVRQQRDHVDRGQRHAESGVLDQLLVPRREHGQPRRQRLPKPGQPDRHPVHPADGTARRPAGGSTGRRNRPLRLQEEAGPPPGRPLRPRSEPGIRPAARCAGAGRLGHHVGMDSTTSARPGPSRLRPPRPPPGPGSPGGDRADRRGRGGRRDGGQRALRLRPRRAVLPVGRTAPGVRLRGSAAADPAAGPDHGGADRRHAGRLPDPARALPGRAGADDGGDEPSPRRGPHRPATRRARGRDLRGVPRRHARADHHDTRLRILGV